MTTTQPVQPAIGTHVIYRGSITSQHGRKFLVEDIGCCGVCEDKARRGEPERLVLFSLDYSVELRHVRQSSVTAVSA